MAELKRIDFTTGEFEAGGKTYRIEGGLGIERYAELQLLEKELGYGLSFKGMHGVHEKLFALLNKQKFAECVVIVNDLIRGIVKLEEREPTVLKICALFMNTEDEDRTNCTPDMMNKKIAIWKAEGIDMRDFFTAASSSVSGFLEIYRSVTQAITGQVREAVKPDD